MAGIFISYRREDSIAYAGRLYDRLQAHFGDEQVFMDIDTLRPGEDFVEAIQRTVASCDALVAVIGRSWLMAQDQKGQRRLDDPEDFVRLEIAAALERGIRVIPALVGNAQMPLSSDLPDDLKKLARRHALHLPDIGFRQNVSALIQVLEAATKAAQAEGKQQSKQQGQRQETGQVANEKGSIQGTAEQQKSTEAVSFTTSEARPDLSEANLGGADLSSANLRCWISERCCHDRASYG